MYEKNAYEVKYPASTTKIMTAILALEKCKLNEMATVSHNAIFSVPLSYSHASLKENEKLTIEQLLNVLLIPSANDAANVIAEHISGSIEDFAVLMNEKAKEIGCKNTHFVNANGIHNESHTTTAYDLALMGKYAMKNQSFRDIVKKTKYTLPATDIYPNNDRIFKTTNELLRENYSSKKDNYYYPNAIGVKTGYTSEAGSCIVAAAKKDNFEVLLVILDDRLTEDGLSQRFIDCKTLFDYAFENYKYINLQEKNSIVKTLEVANATKETKDLNLISKNSINALVDSNFNVSNIEPNIEIKNLKAPIPEGAVVGKISYTIGNDTFSSDLIAQKTVISSGFLSVLLKVCLILIITYILYKLLSHNSNNSRKNKKNTLNEKVSIIEKKDGRQKEKQNKKKNRKIKKNINKKNNNNNKTSKKGKKHKHMAPKGQIKFNQLNL